MVDLTKIKKDISWLIEQVECILSFALSATKWSPAHESATGNKYLEGTLVYNEGKIYKCRLENNGVPTSNSLYWKCIGLGWLLSQEQADWNSTGGDNFIRNKPTKLSDFINDITINSTENWLVITENQTLALNVSYLTNNATKLELTLPTINSLSKVRVASKLGGWKLIVPVGWSVLLADEIVTESIESTLDTDSIELVPTLGNKYLVTNLFGNVIFNN
jgi:hypothetical protein